MKKLIIALLAITFSLGVACKKEIPEPEKIKIELNKNSDIGDEDIEGPKVHDPSCKKGQTNSSGLSWPCTCGIR